MSVTFGVESPIDFWTVQCNCGTVSVGNFSTYQEAYAAAFDSNLDPVVCEDDFCAAYPATPFAVLSISAPELNVSNVNATVLFDVLGFVGAFEDHSAGSLAGTDFMGRVLVAAAVNPVDAGVPVSVSSNNNFVNCGRSKGYVDERLLELENIAVHAIKHNQNVIWG